MTGSVFTDERVGAMQEAREQGRNPALRQAAKGKSPPTEDQGDQPPFPRMLFSCTVVPSKGFRI